MKLLEAPKLLPVYSWMRTKANAFNRPCKNMCIYIHTHTHTHTHARTHTHTHTHTHATVPRKRQESESPTPHPLSRNVHKSPGHFLKAQSRNDCLKACHKILQFCFQAWWVLCQGACSRGERSHWPGVDPHRPVKLSATSAGHMECRCAQVNPAGPGQRYLPLCHFPHHHPPPLIPSRWHPLIPTKMPTEPATPRAPSAWQACKWKTTSRIAAFLFMSVYPSLAASSPKMLAASSGHFSESVGLFPRKLWRKTRPLGRGGTLPTLF